MKKLDRMIVCCVLSLCGASAHAIPILSVDSVTVDPSADSQFVLDVSISGLAGEFVGTYDLTLSFDDQILSLARIAFGPFLDGPVNSAQGVFESAGSVDVFEISLDVLLNQDGSTPFSLFSATFDIIGAGTSPLDLRVNAIGDFFGRPLDVQTRSGSVMVTPVPGPGTHLLLGAALLALGLVRAMPRRASAPGKRSAPC